MLSTASKFEFRCSHCWQPMYTSTDEIGKSVECKCCKKEVTVPEPTEEQIQRASQIEESEVFEAPVEEGIFADVSFTPEEVRELSKRRAEQTVANQEDGYVSPATISASPIRRLIAYVIDGVLLVTAFAVGGAAFVVLHAAGAIEMNENIRSLSDLPLQGILLFGFFPLGLSIIQWQMIATQGQTVGKKLAANQDRRRLLQSAGVLSGRDSTQLATELAEQYPLVRAGRRGVHLPRSAKVHSRRNRRHLRR